jgi:PAS domain-containing protein
MFFLVGDVRLLTRRPGWAKMLPSLPSGFRAMEIEHHKNGVHTSATRASDLSVASMRHPAAWSSSDLLASILDGVADGIAAHDASGQLLFMNDAGARMCGYANAGEALAAPPDDFAGRVEVFDANGVKLSASELPGLLAARGQVVPERIVRLQIRRSGGERWLSVKATPVLDRVGAVRMSISIFRDVTRERLAEAERDRVLRELELERARLAALVEQLRASAAESLDQRPLDR